MRTDIDFSNHHLQVTKNEFVHIYWLKRSDTMNDNIKFVVAGGITAVTGDYGEWIFNREFLPSKGGHVDDFYWKSKLRGESGADGDEWDNEGTKKEILRLLADEERNWSSEELEYLNEILDRTDSNEEDYRVYAYMENCGRFDYENIPYETKTKYWLKAVFDGFQEICKLCIK